MAAGLVWALAGCGGGGGGIPTEQDPDTGVIRAALLSFDTANAGFVGGFAVYAVDMIAGLGQLAVDYVERAAPDGSRAYNGCSAEQQSVSFVDADGSGGVTAGDTVDVRLSTCQPYHQVGDTVTGEIRIRVLAATDGGRSALRAEVQIGRTGLLMANLTTPERDGYVAGSFVLDWQRSASQARLAVTASGANDLRREFRGNGVSTDRLYRPQVVRTMRHDLARTELTATLDYESEDLRGRFEVSTPAPVTSWLNTFPESRPDQGWFRMTGAGGDHVDVRPQDRLGAPVRLELDDGGDGTVDAAGDVRWDDVVRGHLWRDLYPLGTGPYETHLSRFELKQAYADGLWQPVHEAVRVQFSRPPAPGTRLRFRLVDAGRYLQSTTVTTEVPATVEQQGAVALIRPLQPLRYSNAYRVEVAPDDQPFGSPVTVADANGATLQFPSGSLSSFATPDELRPVIRFTTAAALLEPGRPVGLSADASMKLDRVARIAWQQLDGVPLVIESPASIETAVRLADGAQDFGTARLRLTLTHVDGATESVEQVLVAPGATPPASGWFFKLVQEGGAGFIGREWAGVEDPGQFSVTAAPGSEVLGVGYSLVQGARYSGWNFSVRLVPGEVVQPGMRYDMPLGGLIVQPQPGQPAISWLVDTSFCFEVSASVSVHELVFAPDGTLQRLAADLVGHCGGPSAPPLKIWARYNSTVPLPP